MIIRELSKVNNGILYDAILLATYAGYPMKSVYVDCDNECAVTFDGEMTELIIKEFFFSMNSNVTCDLEPEDVVYDEDYQYIDGNTVIYTKEGWKY